MVVNDVVTEALLHVKLGISVVIHIQLLRVLHSSVGFAEASVHTRKCDKRQLRIELVHRQLGGSAIRQDVRQETQ